MATSDALPWVTYQRVSTDDQAREGVSLDVQRDACRHLALAGRYPVVEDISDPGFSAKDMKRPGMKRLLELVHARQIGGVIIYKLDRLTRNQRDLCDLIEVFNRLEISLISVSEQLHTGSATGRMFVSLLGILAQWERETIAERVTAGMHHRMASGGYVGGRVPTGLRAVGPPGGRVLEIDPVLGPKVAAIWPMIIAGRTLRDVGLALERSGVRCHGRDGWTLSAIHSMLKRKRYVGFLVTAEDQAKAMAKLAARSCPGRRSDTPGARGPSAKASRVWLLSGLARCAQCGCAMIGVSATGGHGGMYHYYRCTGRARRGVGYCKAVDLSAERWEPAAVESLVRLISKQGELEPALVELQQRLTRSTAPLTEERKSLVMAQDKLRSEIGRLVDLAASGAQVGEAVAKGLAERQAKAEQIARQIARLDGQLAIQGMSADQVQVILAQLRANVGDLPAKTPEDQSLALRQLVSRVVLKPCQNNKQKGQVDLSINLPVLFATAFVSPSSMVEVKGVEPMTF